MLSTKVALCFLVLVALLVSLVPTAIPAQSPGNGVALDVNADREAKLWQSGERVDLFSPWNYSSGNASGKFVRFSYDEANGSISDMEVNTSQGMTKVIDQMDFSSLSGAPNLTGPIFAVDGETMKLVAHNNPTALLQIGSSEENETMRITFASGVNITSISSLFGANYNISGNGVQMWLQLYDGDVTEDLSNGSIGFTFNAGGIVMLRQLPNFESVGMANEETIMNAVANGSIGAEVWAAHRSLGYVYETANLNGMSPKVNVTDGRVEVTIPDQLEGGMILLMNVDHETIGNDSMVQLNGSTVNEANSIANLVRNVGDNGTSPGYYVLQGENTSKYLVYIPNLDGNTTVVLSNKTSSDQAVVISPSVGIGVVISLVAIGAIVAGITYKRRS